MKGPYENIKRKQWTCNSWKNYQISQQPNYQDVTSLENVKLKVIIRNIYKIAFWSTAYCKLQRNCNAKRKIATGIN